MAKAVTGPIAPVRGLLESSRDAAAAELFVESVAFGKRACAQLLPGMREAFVRNAPTYLDELQDPGGADLDLAALRACWEPALLTSSDDSPPFFAPILDRIASALPQCERHPPFPSMGGSPWPRRAERRPSSGGCWSAAGPGS